MLKRVFDFIFALILLIFTAPIILVCAVLVKAKLGAPVLFKQERPGLNGRLFILYKFRTMIDKYNEDGELLLDGVRLTPLGRILRRLSLDELPQLWNVLKGEMSLVGPRPLLMEYLPLYTPEQARRHEVKPGITGWAQVNGRNALSWEDRFTLDVWYVDNRSFWLDLKILWLTVVKVFKSEGINQQGQVTMEKFRGVGS
jgi:sugar transferase EpsL